MFNRLKILNLCVDSVNMHEAMTAVGRFVDQGRQVHTIFAVNPEKNFAAIKDPILRETLQAADILIPDGTGIVMAAFLFYGIRLSRLPGVELMHAVCDLSSRKGYRIFIYGGMEAVNNSACERLRALYPGIQIVGRSNGYVEKEKMTGLIEKINDSGAQILFLALGSPMQEKWLAEYKKNLKSVRVCQGIGGTLDTIAGTVKRAPDIWCRFNAEWLYRLISQPRRIKRQRVLPIFAVQVLWEKLKQKRIGSIR